MSKKPLCIDGFCGLGGWAEGFIAEGWDVIGYDIEKHDYGNGTYPGTLIIQDLLTVHGSQFKDADCLVFSPPCQRYSYMAMPWSRGKAQAAKILADESGALLADLNKLFYTCFRLQREASAAAGHHIPAIIENVRGAQRWVGKAQWHFGSFYLWGDVPALMPIPGRMRKTTGSLNKGDEKWNRPILGKGEGNKTSGMNWSDQTKRGQDFTRIAGQQAGKWTNPEAGTKGYASRLGDSQVSRMYSSKSKARKEASAMIAKIPPSLAQWIAKVYKPKLA